MNQTTVTRRTMRSWRLCGPASLAGTVRVPGDKSLSHRALVLGAMAHGTTAIRRPPAGARIAGRRWLRCGRSGSRSPSPRTVSSGFTAAARMPGASRRRSWMPGTRGPRSGCWQAPWPADRSAVCSPAMARCGAVPCAGSWIRLRAMGATLLGRADGGFPPLAVRGGELRGIAWRSPVASAQVKTAVLLAGLQAAGETSVAEPFLSRDHTERMLTAFGVTPRREGVRVTISGRGAARRDRAQHPRGPVVGGVLPGRGRGAGWRGGVRAGRGCEPHADRHPGRSRRGWGPPSGTTGLGSRLGSRWRTSRSPERDCAGCRSAPT